MKGHIRERSPGHWAIVIDVPQDGKRKQRWHSFKGTKRQAQIECARLLTELKAGTTIEPSRMTVAAFLERWIEHMRGQVSPSHERYAEIARKNLAPLLRRPDADKGTTGPYQHCLRQGARQRPQGRQWRAFRAHGD